MSTTNPYAPPSAEYNSTTLAETPSAGNAFAEAWRLLFAHWPVLFGAVAIVWVPSALYMSYQDYFVIDEDDLRSSFRMANLFDSFVGILASGAVVAAIHASLNGERVRLEDALSTGWRAWPRIWWTRTLLTIGLLLGLVLLIVPGFYFALRWSFAINIAVVERQSGISALRRSWELTKGFTLILLVIEIVHWTVVLGCLVLFGITVVVFPDIDHWLLDASATVFAHLLHTYFLICLCSVYQTAVAAEGANGAAKEATV